MDAAAELVFRVSGPDADGLSAELTQVISEELGVTPRRRAEDLPSKAPGTRGVDPLAVTALVLSLPSAVRAAQDLAQRLELKAKMDRFLARAREKLAKRPGNRVEIVAPRAKTLRLEQAESAEILEVALEITVRVKRSREPS